MILLPLLAAALTPPFAPPLDIPLRYEQVADRPLAGNARVTVHQALRFERRGGGYAVEVRALDHAIHAPSPYRERLEALFGTSDGLSIRTSIDQAGRITGVIDPAASWAAFRAAEARQIERIEADPGATPARKASARALFEQSFDLSPPDRDARLEDMAATLLAPPLPALAVGERRAFTAQLRAPAGPVAASGTIQLVAADAERLDYLSELTADPAATAAAVAKLEAALASRTDPAERARLGAAAARLRGTTYIERTTLTIDRASGLLRHSHTDRIARHGDEPGAPFESDDLRLLP